jgi:hypothetical protein
LSRTYFLVAPPPVGEQPTQKSDKPRYCFDGEGRKIYIRDHQRMKKSDEGDDRHDEEYYAESIDINFDGVTFLSDNTVGREVPAGKENYGRLQIFD